MNWIKKHKILTGCVVLLLLLLLLIFWFVWSKLDRITYDPGQSTISPDATTIPQGTQPTLIPEDVISGLETVATEPQVPDSEIAKESSVVNILLLGTDERTGGIFSDNARSDSMILVSIDKQANTVKLISLERGMGVPVLAGPYAGQYDWLTHIFNYGGASLVTETVRTCFRVDVSSYVRVNFNSVTTLVDALGGIDIEMTAAEAQYFNDGIVKQPGVFHAGWNQLDGYQALCYARLREIDSDWTRIQRQRRVILAMVEAMKSASLLELNELLDLALPLVQTNMTKLEIASLMTYAPNLLGASFDQMTIPADGTYGVMTGMGGRTLYAVDFEANAQILQAFLYGEDDHGA